MIFNSVVIPHKVPQQKVQICGTIETGEIVVSPFDPNQTLNVNVVNDNPIAVEVTNELTIEKTEFTRGDLIEVSFTKKTNALFPAGATYFDIQPLSNGKKITVNGKDFYLGSRKSGEDRIDMAASKQDYPKAINIDVNGLTENYYIITIAYPSSSGITEEVLNDNFYEDFSQTEMVRVNALKQKNYKPDGK